LPRDGAPLLSFVEALTQPPTRLKLMQSSTFGDTLGRRRNLASSLPDEAKHAEAAIAASAAHCVA
jgi:hypothetical protein